MEPEFFTLEEGFISCMICSIPWEQLGRKTSTKIRTFDISHPMFLSGAQKSVRFAIFHSITDASQYATKG